MPVTPILVASSRMASTCWRYCLAPIARRAASGSSPAWRAISRRSCPSSRFFPSRQWACMAASRNASSFPCSRAYSAIARARRVLGIWSGSFKFSTPNDAANSRRLRFSCGSRSRGTRSAMGLPPGGVSGCSSKPRQSISITNSFCSLTRLLCSAMKQYGHTKSEYSRATSGPGSPVSLVFIAMGTPFRIEESWYKPMALV